MPIAGLTRARFDLVAKRAFDVPFASLLLLVIAPALALVAIAIKVDSRGPVFFRCRRVGHRGREFQMLKFRKMHQSAAGPALTLGSDSRFTRVGRFLAVSKLDEVPQLWHVVKGEMSLVGPRPEDPSFVSLFSDPYRVITQVRPGITGLSQLAFAEEGRILDPDDCLNHYIERLLPQKVTMDGLYARKRTIGMDLRILVWTAAAVLLRRDVAVHRTTGKLNLRRRPAVAAPASADLPAAQPAFGGDTVESNP
jgi:lipopolysaccharide/colanic/teichoic acid biosynthesis glycosyltransferase